MPRDKTPKQIRKEIAEKLHQHVASERILKLVPNEEYGRKMREYSAKQIVEELQTKLEHYGQNYYANKEEMIKKYQTDAPKRYKLTDEQLNQKWNDYKKRERLILSGQYDDIRAKIMKENYISSLKNWNMPRNIIYSFEQMTPLEFEQLYRNPRLEKGKGEILPKGLPKLKPTHYPTKETVGSSDWVEMVDEIKYVLKETDYFINADYVTLSTAEQGIYLLESRLPMRQRRELKKRNEKLSDEDNSKVILERMIANIPVYTKKGRKTVQEVTDKYGNTYYYIPFVGTTRPGGKNADLVRAIRDVHRKHYKE